MEVAVVKVINSGIRFVLVPITLTLPPDALWKLLRTNKLNNPMVLDLIREQGITPLNAKTIIEEFEDSENELRGYNYEPIDFHFAFNTIAISSSYKRYTKNVIFRAIREVRRPLILGTNILKENSSKVEEITSIPSINLAELWKISNYPSIKLFLEHGRLRDKIFI